MKTQYKIGKSKENDIVVNDKDCSDIQAEINYDRGDWILNNLEKDRPIFLNGKKVENQKLNKNDKIKIGKQTIHWNNYLYEGEDQGLYIKDIFTYNGRISRANFRALSILSIGLMICVFFSPGLLGAIGSRRTFNEEKSLQFIQHAAPILYTIGFSIIGIGMVLLMIKRIRDTGNPIWTLLIPIYNLKILYFRPSKK